MAEVTGQIGNEAVSLDNAATEATLKLLLQATLATTKEQKAAIASLVQKAGLDPDKVEAANEGLVQTASFSEKFGGALGGLTVASNKLQQKFLAVADFTEKLTSGKAEASELFGAMSKLPLGIGLVASGFQKLAQFQEANLKTYQELSASGINFSGSLTNMRLAASGMYMSMDQFTKFMKENAQTMARLGGTADEGAIAFTKMSNQLLKSGIGDDLRALGYTSDQVNQGLASYLELTGARSKEEMANTKAITASAAEYMTQLDGLAQLTGKSREEQEKALKEANQNAAIQQKLAGMTEEQKAAYNRGLAEMSQKFGKAGTEMYQAQVLGIPPLTKASQQLTALAPEVAKASQGMADVAKRGGTAAETMKYSAQATQAGVEASKKFGDGLKAAMSFKTGGTADAINALGISAVQAEKQGRDTAAKELEMRNKIAEDQKTRSTSEANTAAQTQKSMQELGQEILKILLPAFNALQPMLLKITKLFADVVTYLAESPNLLKALGVAVVGLTGIMMLKGAASGWSSVTGMLGGKGKGGVAGALTGGGGAGEMVGGAADGLGKLGPMMSSLGKGAGEMFSGIMQGIAAGLRAFAQPQVILGAAGFAAAIALIGAGIAGASWLLGKALPTLAEGIGAFEDMDGENLINVGKGIGALGLGLAAFGAGGVMSSVGGVVSGLAESFGSLFGAKSPVEKLKEFAALGPGLEQAGTGIQALGTSLDTLLSTDLSRIKELSAALVELKEASKQPEKSISGAIGGFISSKLGSSDAPAVAAGPAGTGSASETSEILKREMQQLNKQTIELVKAMKEAAENTKRTASLIASNGNIFKAG